MCLLFRMCVHFNSSLYAIRVRKKTNNETKKLQYREKKQQLHEHYRGYMSQLNFRDASVKLFFVSFTYFSQLFLLHSSQKVNLI